MPEDTETEEAAKTSFLNALRLGMATPNDGLAGYVKTHTDRGECRCGKCSDHEIFDYPVKPDPVGHTVDMIFFPVSAINNPTAEEFINLTKSHKGEFGEVNPLDGKEHNYMELGGWLGDQGLALMYMALGSLLGVFSLLTPKTVLPPGLPEELIMNMAGSGFVSIIKKKEA